MKSALETCLSEGHFLLLTDCNVDDLMKNKKIETSFRPDNKKNMKFRFLKRNTQDSSYRNFN